MSTIQFHRRFKAQLPFPHFCEEWNVHTFSPQGDAETYRVSFKLDRFEKPCYEVQIERQKGGFLPLDRKTHYKRISRVMGALKDEFNDYKHNRNYSVKID